MARQPVNPGNTISLGILLRDDDGYLRDPILGEGPFVDIFPPNADPHDIGSSNSGAYIVDASQVSLGTGPGTSLIQRIDVGHYEYDFEVPSDGEVGVWFDRWTATIDGLTLEQIGAFVVVEGTEYVISGQLYNNNLISIELDKNIAATDGSTLEENYYSYYTTTYNPLYSSTRRVRLDLGPSIDIIPDDTINLAIFEASIDANYNTFNTSAEDNDYFKYVRRRWVTCRAQQILLSSEFSRDLALRKSLGDLEVEWDRDALREMLAKTSDCIAKWLPQLEAGGTARSSLKTPKAFIKSIYDPEYPATGRGWDPTTSTPGSNTRVKNSRRFVNSFAKRGKSVHKWWGNF